MSNHLPVLVVGVPLLTSFSIFAAGWIKPALCFPLGVLGLLFTTGSSLWLLEMVMEKGVVTYELGGWPPPWGIAYVVDGLNGAAIGAASLAALICWISSRPYVTREFQDRLGVFYGIQMLFVTGVMGILVTGDAFNLYVLLEIASITAYALIAMGGGRAPYSSLNYVFMGTIGACFYLLGVGYLYIMTGSLNMQDLASLLKGINSSHAVLVAFILSMVGLWIKMAFFPLHGWLPNAYSHAPSPAATLIAPLMTKTMVYVMIRLVLSLFGPIYCFTALGLGDLIVGLASLGVVASSLMALAQRDLKRMLSYVIIIEVGYMVGGLWLGNRTGITGAILHMLNDIFMTLCAFMALGNIIYRVPATSFEGLRGLFSRMPYTMAGLVAASLSIIGVPPTCGFFSKWYLLQGAIEAGHYEFLGALLFSSLSCLALFFRAFEHAYFSGGTHGHGGNGQVAQEAPAHMVIPLMVVAGGLVALGLSSGKIVALILNPAIPRGIL